MFEFVLGFLTFPALVWLGCKLGFFSYSLTRTEKPLV